ncbi:MAG: hypothetical protein WD733_15285 [Bryobacterales bacterium]
MALFTDGLVSQVSDLIAYEANLPEVASAEGIDLATKLQLAHTEVGAEITAASQRPGNVYFARGGGWQTSGAEGNYSRFELSKVVVTPPLSLWHTFQTLAIVYRDAYNRKLNDKYLPKWKEYKDLAQWASGLLFQTGIGIASNPVPRPASPTLDWVASSAAALAVFVRVTWVGAQGVEGAASAEQAVTVPVNHSLRVTIGEAPAGVSGWHVYAGSSSGEVFRQNAEALEPGPAWVMPAGGLISGAAVGDGQLPEVFRTVPRFLQRG